MKLIGSPGTPKRLINRIAERSHTESSAHDGRRELMPAM
jgi:hypothetical protein